VYTINIQHEGAESIRKISGGRARLAACGVRGSGCVIAGT
jgi:hypothetical protein